MTLEGIILAGQSHQDQFSTSDHFEIPCVQNQALRFSKSNLMFFKLQLLVRQVLEVRGIHGASKLPYSSFHSFSLIHSVTYLVFVNFLSWILTRSFIFTVYPFLKSVSFPFMFYHQSTHFAIQYAVFSLIPNVNQKHISYFPNKGIKKIFFIDYIYIYFLPCSITLSSPTIMSPMNCHPDPLWITLFLATFLF